MLLLCKLDLALERVLKRTNLAALASFAAGALPVQGWAVRLSTQTGSTSGKGYSSPTVGRGA
jgi:hypothetical protein